MDNTNNGNTTKTSEVKLERVLGLTVTNTTALDCDSNSSTIAYPAGCVIVLYNIRKNKQSHIISNSKKTITCLAFSGDGRYLVTGECGHLSHVRVWDVQDHLPVSEMSGHKYGINCVAFSPNMKYVVSVGSQHDMTVNVWDWRGKVKVASNKVSCKVKALSFSCEGSYFVTVGNNHVKFWYLEYSRTSKYKLETVPLMGRSAILGDQRNNYFCDVACGRGENADSTYAITKSGILCEFNGRRLLDKWVELRTSGANSIKVGESHIVVGCSDGIVRCFSPYNLRFICTLPRPHFLGVDVAKGMSGKYQSLQNNTKYPDTIAVTLDEIHKKVTCIYSDHSIYVWDIKDTKKIGKTHSSLYHGACIWGIEHYPELSNGVLPSGTFLTCSSDDTIRVWNFDSGISQSCPYQRNIYSYELLKIFYTDPDFTFLCDSDINPSGSNDKVDTVYDGRNGVRCLRISPDGNHLASGDRSGNIRIYDIQCAEMMCKIEAHDSEVLCLEYSRSVNGKGKYLASASRDRLIHIFDAEQDYAFLQTLDDHSSSVTAVRFVNINKLQLISCGADKSVIFRQAQFTPRLKFVREHHMVGKTTFYDMDVDAQQQHIVTACQDQNIRTYSVTTTKLSRSFHASQTEEGTLIKVILDPTGTYLATSSTDKTVSIFNYYTGECISIISGHSELVTSLIFSSNGKYIVSVCGDGCVFLWRLPVEVTQNIIAKQAVSNSTHNLWQDGKKTAVTEPIQMAERDGQKKDPNFSSLVWDSRMKEDLGISMENSPEYRFSIGQLPGWAKKQIVEDSTTSSSYSESESSLTIQPRGRWAQRVDGQGLVVRSYLPSDSIIPYPNNQGQKQNRYSHNEERIFQSREEVNSTSNQVSTAHISLHQETTTITRRETNRIRHPTDSSTASSIRLEDEAEDERSDSGAAESEITYYPPSEEGSEIGNSSFNVQATKNESTRTLPRKLRRSKTENLHEMTPNKSLDHDVNSDGDDLGTSGEGERSFINSMYVSTENLERLDEREKFMKRTYESLERSASSIWQKKQLNEQSHDERKSISAKYLSKSPQNSSQSYTPNSGKQVYSQTKKREELTKALNDARKKLETLGWRKGLSTSKSVGDLRNMPEKETLWKHSPSAAEDGDIRRTSSFGDITAPFASHRRHLPNTPNHADSDAISAPLWARAKQRSDEVNTVKPVASVISTPTKNTMSRSASISALHRSENLESHSPQRTVPDTPTRSVYSSQKSIHTNSSNLTRSSSSSAMNVAGRSTVAAVPPRRLTLAPTHPRWQHSDSSSSDASPTDYKPNTLTARSLVAHWEKKLGNRESSKETSDFYKQTSRSKSEWDLQKACQQTDKKKEESKLKTDIYNNQKEIFDKKLLDIKDNEFKTNATTKALEMSPDDLPVKDKNPSNNSFKYYNAASVPLTRELCEQIAEELKQVTSTAMQVFQRVTMDSELSAMDKASMTTVLAKGVWQAQQNLRPAMPPVPIWPMPQNSSLDPNIFASKTIGNVNNSLSIDPGIGKGSVENPAETVNAMTLLQQYSDKLLSLVEQHINKNVPETSNK
ncbi:mitogen-activated protein kinase-binding protein 1-like [Centruroides sculpturatus]|uniref:mitogen-activated protein kinase-binding protein 1-like n=1 Tax=Centruroides sculpturatus TaxID=218467 RepID=UPI000C6D1F41|nr:mitogen-activated protein kinase-binding protein 1-like [Centruroides sculpturatus]